MNDIKRMRQQLNELFPTIKTELIEFSPTSYELSRPVTTMLIIIWWKENEYFGVSSLTEENELDRMFTNYNDIEFTEYDEALTYILSLIATSPYGSIEAI